MSCFKLGRTRAIETRRLSVCNCPSRKFGVWHEKTVFAWIRGDVFQKSPRVCPEWDLTACGICRGPGREWLCGILTKNLRSTYGASFPDAQTSRCHRGVGFERRKELKGKAQVLSAVQLTARQKVQQTRSMGCSGTSIAREIQGGKVHFTVKSMLNSRGRMCRTIYIDSILIGCPALLQQIRG